jgi:hypothetical protein
VCGSAERTIEIMTQLKTDIFDIKVAKLFSRHIKMDEQVAMLKTGHFLMGNCDQIK